MAVRRPFRRLRPPDRACFNAGMSRLMPVRIVMLALLAASSSCAVLANLPAGGAVAGLTPPTIQFQGATLVQSPSQQRLAAYYCPQVVSVPFGGAGLLCQGFFGPRPRLP